MLLYLEEDLDNAYQIDCKERAKKEKPWIKREKFRNLYEDLIGLYLQKVAENHIFIDTSLEDLPGWVIGEVERTLQNYE
jgi:hypothetical protein|tara:strand:+ start:191 stop:427 length:237 start_codon:yes stop_codon:yes gene_type:complete